MTVDRIKEKFAVIKEEKRPGLILFLTVGFPDLAATRELVPALVAAGADAIELGVPFSDPLAEGPIIQQSSFQALEQGVTLGDCLALVDDLRGPLPETPLILMGYYNPIYSYGMSRFAQQARQVGVDGVIVVDLPHEEVGPLAEHCLPLGIHHIPLLAPTSTDARIQTATASASGFVYCISLTGVTGVRDQVSARSIDLLGRVRAHTSLPLAVGFGISSREHVEAVCRHAEAAVVGSALIRVMLESPRDQLVARASRFVAELAGAPLTATGGTN
jgi:tryptophan synthase alpha chain